MVDLRELLLKIQEQKEMNANLALEFDCMVETEDPTALVKVINYFINYLTQITTEVIEISLNAYRGGSMLSFAVSSDQSDLPPISDQVGDALKTYDATYELVHQEGKFIQIIITFTKAY